MDAVAISGEWDDLYGYSLASGTGLEKFKKYSLSHYGCCCLKPLARQNRPSLRCEKHYSQATTGDHQVDSMLLVQKLLLLLGPPDRSEVVWQQQDGRCARPFSERVIYACCNRRRAVRSSRAKDLSF